MGRDARIRDGRRDRRGRADKSPADAVDASLCMLLLPAGLVEQDDLPVLAGTVQEVVEFYARIKPPAGDKSAGLSTWRQRADSALQAMGLTHVRTSKVGCCSSPA